MAVGCQKMLLLCSQWPSECAAAMFHFLNHIRCWPWRARPSWLRFRRRRSAKRGRAHRGGSQTARRRKILELADHFANVGEVHSPVSELDAAAFGGGMCGSLVRAVGHHLAGNPHWKKLLLMGNGRVKCHSVGQVHGIAAAGHCCLC